MNQIRGWAIFLLLVVLFSPGFAFLIPSQSVVLASSSTIVISEFRTRGPNGGNDEFIELYNLSSSPTNISGWIVKGSNNSGTVLTRASINSGTILDAHCHYLLTNSNPNGGPYSGAVLGDQTYGVGITDDGGIAITTTDGTIVDQIGMSSGSVFKEGTTLAPTTSELNRSYERRPGGFSGKLRRKVFYAKTREDVAKKLTDEKAKQNAGIPLVTEHKTVADYLTSWLEDSVKRKVRLSTYLSYKNQVDLHLSKGLGKHQLTKLTPDHVRRYLNQQLDGDLSARTVSYHHTILKMALKQAMRDGLVARNVAELVDSPKVKKHQVTPLDHGEAQKFLKAIKGDRLEALFSVALSLGLRRGEALALKWENVDFEQQTLTVTQSLSRINKQLVFSEPKTNKSRRVLDLPLSLAVKLKEHRTRQLQERMSAGRYWQDIGLVFCTTIGTPIDPRNVKRRLDKILDDAKIPHFRIHDLRHFAASLMLAQGVPLKVVSEILGHAQIGITGDLYTHVLPKVRKEAIDLLDAVLTAGSQGK